MKMIWISLPVFCRYKYNKNKPSWLYPFASKMANYSRHSEIWNFRKNSKSTSFSSKTAIFPFSNFFQSLNVPPKIDQFGRKRCQNKHEYVSYHFLKSFLLRVFSNSNENKTEKVQSKTARQVCDRENIIWIHGKGCKKFFFLKVCIEKVFWIIFPKYFWNQISQKAKFLDQ